MRNALFEDGFITEYHAKLLDDEDELLSALLKPLADVNDLLTDDEIEKLPKQLQYYEGYRSDDHNLIETVIDALYQVSFSFFKVIKCE